MTRTFKWAQLLSLGLLTSLACASCSLPGSSRQTGPTPTPTSSNVREYPLANIESGPSDITAGPDGALWFTEYSSGKIGRITTTGQVTEYPVPTTASDPAGITAGPDGALWFTEQAASRIGRITP